MSKSEATVIIIGSYATHGAQTGEKMVFSNSVLMTLLGSILLMELVMLINMALGQLFDFKSFNNLSYLNK